MSLEEVIKKAYVKGVCLKNKLPIMFLFALQDGTTFNYIQGSHATLLSGEGVKDKLEPTQIMLQKGELVAFHPLLVHFGGAYSKPNARIHLYCMTKEIPLPIDQSGVVLTYSLKGIRSCGRAKEEVGSLLLKGREKKRKLKELRARRPRDERGRLIAAKSIINS